MTTALTSLSMSEARCPHCMNSSRNHVLFHGINADNPQGARLPIVRCANCSVIFTDPNAISATDDELYFDGYYGEASQESLVNKTAIAIFQRERQRLAFGDHIPRRVLDVGCGDGTFLRNLPKGVEPVGYEPSKPGQKALTKLGISFVDIDNPPKEALGSFDLITLWHSLEHVEKTDEVFRKLVPLLANDGVLFISVPNMASLQAMIFSGRWFHLDPTRHLYHYTLSSLRDVCARNGFQIQSATTISLEYGVFGWWQSFFNYLPFDFNMGFRILKWRKRYPRTIENTCAYLCYLLLGGPFAAIGLVMTLIEGLLGRGGVLNVRLKRQT